MFASCTLLWGLARPHILGKPAVEDIVTSAQNKKTPDLGIKDKVNIFKVCNWKSINYSLEYCSNIVCLCTQIHTVGL